ncbi:MAG: hypothetical protein ABGW78_02755 [Pirellulales bacterium]
MWKNYRILVFGGLSLALLLIAIAVKEQGVDQTSPLLLYGLCFVSLAWLTLFISDIVLHAWHNKGQACMHCGKLRKLKPFHLESACPHCGK